MRYLYIKNEDGTFSPFDLDTAPIPTDPGYVIAYDSEDGSPKCIVQHNDKNVALNMRKLGQTHAPIIPRELADTLSSLPGKLQQASIAPLSDAEKQTVKQKAEEQKAERQKAEEQKAEQAFQSKLKDRILTGLKTLEEQRLAIFEEMTKTGNALTVQGKINLQYMHYIHDKLLACVTAEDFTLDTLKAFFKTLWDETKSTALCYTALPDNPAVHLLCDIAKELAASKKETSAIQFLMPDVNTESRYDNFLDLDKMDISTVLKTHILSDDGKTLIPIAIFKDRASEQRILGYYPQITIENDFDQITNPYHLLTDDANDAHTCYLTEHERARLARHNDDLQNLFNIKKEYDAIINNPATLLGQLKKLGREFRSADAHGGRGTGAVAASSAFTAIATFKEYYVKLKPEQIEPIPEALKTAIDRLFSLASDKQGGYQIEVVNTIPKQMVDGVIYLKRNQNGTFAYSLNLYKEINKQKTTVSGTLPPDISEANTDAILTHLAEKGHIPESKRVFISQADKDETCIGLQGGTIRKLTDENHKALNAISLSEETKSNLIEHLKDKFHSAQMQLANEAKDTQEALDERNTQRTTVYGRDHYGINKRIVALMQLDLNTLIRNEDDLKDFMQLSVQEIGELCQSPEIREAIFKVLGGVNEFENWVMLVHDNHPEKIEALFSELVVDLTRKIIINATGLSGFLSSLLPEKCAAVMKAIIEKGRLGSLNIPNRGLTMVLNICDAEQRKAIADMIIQTSMFQYFAKDTRRLSHVFALLAPQNNPPSPASDQSTALFNAIGVNHIAGLIQTATNFEEIFEHAYLSSDQYTAVFNAMGVDRVARLIQSRYDYSSVFKFLSEDQRTAVFDAMGADRVASFVENSNGFIDVLEFTPTEQQRTAVFDAMGADRVAGLIRSATDFRSVFKLLSTDQRTAVFDAMGANRVASFVKDKYDFTYILEHTPTEQQRTAVFNAMGVGRVADLVKPKLAIRDDYVEAIFSYFKKLTNDQCIAILKNIISDASDLCFGYSSIKNSSKKLLLETIGIEHVASLIKSDRDFVLIYNTLGEQKLTDILNVMDAAHIANAIVFRDTFRKISALLSKDKLSTVIEALEPKVINKLIFFDDDLNHIFKYCNVEKRKAIYKELVKERRYYLLTYSPANLDLFRHLSPDECYAVLNNTVGNLSNTIINEHIFWNFLTHFSTKDLPTDWSIKLFASVLSNNRNAAYITNKLNNLLREKSAYMLNTLNPSESIKALHQELYALLSKPTNARVAASRNDALQIIKREILHLLNKAKPGEIDKETLEKATQLLSLHRNRFHLFSKTTSLGNKAYLKHVHHHSQGSVNTPPTTGK